MENKRDASSAGLPWPTTSTRSSQNMSTPAESPVVTSPSALTSMPSAPLETLTSTSGTDTLAPSGMYTAEPHPMLLFLDLILNIRRLIDILALPNELCIRFTSRSSHTPTTPGSYSSKKFLPQESPNVVIPNTTSTVFLAIGSGLYELQTIGAIISSSHYYMDTIPSTMFPSIRSLLRKYLTLP